MSQELGLWTKPHVCWQGVCGQLGVEQSPQLDARSVFIGVTLLIVKHNLAMMSPTWDSESTERFPYEDFPWKMLVICQVTQGRGPRGRPPYS